MKGTATMAIDMQEPEAKTFVEVALTLGGKSAEEARTTGTLDRADEQVEALFAPQYQTAQSPAHRAVWDQDLPVELFDPKESSVPPSCQKVMDDSIEVVRRHKAAGTLLDERGKVTDALLHDLADAGYWGLLVDREYGGQGTPFSAFSRFVTRMATIDPTVAGLASVHGCIGAVDPLADLRVGRAEVANPAETCQRRATFRIRADRAGRRVRPDGAEDHGAARRRRLRGRRREAVHHQRRAGPDRRAWSA